MIEILSSNEIDVLIRKNGIIESVKLLYDKKIIVKLEKNEINNNVILFSLHYYFSDKDDKEASDRAENIYFSLNCDDCQKFSKNNLKFVNGIGTGNLFPDIMLILQAGGDVSEGNLLPHQNKISPRYMVVGQTSRVLKKSLLNSNKKFSCWITNILKCVILNNGTTITACYENCYNRILKNEINILKPIKIVSMSSFVHLELNKLNIAHQKINHPM